MPLLINKPLDACNVQRANNGEQREDTICAADMEASELDYQDHMRDLGRKDNEWEAHPL